MTDKAPFTTEQIGIFATGEVKAAESRDHAETKFRKAWWDLTLALATIPSREKKLVGEAQAKVREITGQSIKYIQFRTRTGRNFGKVDLPEIEVLPPTMAIELVTRGNKATPEFIDLMREIDADPDRGVRDFIDALPKPEPKPEPKPTPRSEDVTVPDYVPDDIMDAPAPAPAPADTSAETTPESDAEPLPTFHAVGGEVVTVPTSAEWDEKIAAADVREWELRGVEKVVLAYDSVSPSFIAGIERLTADQRAEVADKLNDKIDADIELRRMLKRRLNGGELEYEPGKARIAAVARARELNDMAKKGGDVDWDKEAARMTSE